MIKFEIQAFENSISVFEDYKSMDPCIYGYKAISTTDSHGRIVYVFDSSGCANCSYDLELSVDIDIDIELWCSHNSAFNETAFENYFYDVIYKTVVFNTGDDRGVIGEKVVSKDDIQNINQWGLDENEEQVFISVPAGIDPSRGIKVF